MSDRPYGMLAMSPYAKRTACPPSVLDGFDSFADVDSEALVEDFASAGEALARAEFHVTGWGCPPLTAAALDAAPRLRLVAHAAGSVKHHVTEDVWNRGVVVTSAAAANAEPVAEYTRAAVLLACKRAFVAAADYRRDGWPGEERPDDVGYLRRVVGVVGASRIGRRVLELLRGYSMELLLADPYCDAEEAAALGARLVDVDELCIASDVVTVHAPELPETRGLVGTRRLSLMRDGAVLINTARGSLVDTEALTEHCRIGRVDAVLDVTDPEPLARDHPLLHLPNVLVTPHVAGAQGTEIALLGEYAVEETRRFFAGEPLRGKVTREELPRLA
ncbi:MAG: hydroxyacid dehydrogenase [Stackebrandtia sp.]